MSAIQTVPKREMKSFCRWVAQATEKYFENPEVQKRFEAWKKERDQNEQTKS